MGTVTSVGLADASTTPIYAVTGSPVTGSGTLTLTLNTEPANEVFAGPASGPNAEPTFRALVPADLPAGTTISIGAFDSQAENANGLALVAGILSTQSADGTHPGMVNLATQTLGAGNKTFTGTLGIGTAATGNQLTIQSPSGTFTEIDILGPPGTAHPDWYFRSVDTSEFVIDNAGSLQSPFVANFVGMVGFGGQPIAGASFAFHQFASNDGRAIIANATSPGNLDSWYSASSTLLAWIDSAANPFFPSLNLNGSTSGIFTQNANATTTSYAVTWPAAQGGAGTVPTNNGSGALTWTVPAGGSVTAVSVASANGLAGVSSGGATPALTLSTTITGLLKGNGTAISAATPGTDYQVPLTFSDSLVNTANTITLVGDSATPGASKYYGTNGASTLGYYAIPAGSVTSVALSDGSTSPIYAISGSPVTGAGTLTFTLSTQTANTVFAGPASGAAAQPAFRALNIADMTIANQAIAATAIDWSTGNGFSKTLSGNTTFTFSNQTSGQTLIVRLTNTTSNFTVTWPTVRWTGGTAPTMSIGAVSDVYTFYYDGSNTYGSYVQNMS